MKAQEGKVGRIFFLRLENGDIIPECIEQFAAGEKVSTGYAILVGGIGGGQLVAGPRRSDTEIPEPIVLPVDGAHEVAGIGVLAPDVDGRPVLHIHAALGRAGNTVTGCLRPGVNTWLVGEVVLVEVLGIDAARLKDEKSGFALFELK